MNDIDQNEIAHIAKEEINSQNSSAYLFDDEDDDDDNEEYESDYSYYSEDNYEEDNPESQQSTWSTATYIPGDMSNGVKRQRSLEGPHVIERSLILPFMAKRMSSVSDVLAVPAPAAASLLHRHGWNKQQLLQSYYDNCDKVTKEAGVFHRCNNNPAPIVSPTTTDRNCCNANDDSAANNTQSCSDNKKHKCYICFDEDYEKHEMMAMPCKHEFCRDCWSGFLTSKINDGPSCIHTVCPHDGCNELVTEDEVSKIVPNLLEKYREYQLGSFVESNKKARWCPGVGCDRIAIAFGTAGNNALGAMNMKCDNCNTSFCLNCTSEEPHQPLSCSDLETWKNNYSTESSESWIHSNTKPCPACKTRIEKNQGCNHMTCRQCHHDFCWICMGDWANHTNCNRYEGDINSDQQELDRGVHFYERFHIHDKAQEFAKRQLHNAEQRVAEAQIGVEDGEIWKRLDSLKAPLKKANEQLVECRRVLKYTYIFAYCNLKMDYKDGSQNKEMVGKKNQFEHHQEMLEKYTEDLSELAEKCLDQINQVGVINQVEAVARYVKAIVEYVGLELY
jgi:ariadne-1